VSDDGNPQGLGSCVQAHEKQARAGSAYWVQVQSTEQDARNCCCR